MSPWFEWVPSKANIADLPSRGDESLLRELGSQEAPMVLPDVRAWDEPAAAWMERAAEGEAPEGAGGARERAGMGRVTLGNLARSRPAEGDVRVDRTSGAALANPFEMARGRGRAEVCQACDEVRVHVVQNASKERGESAISRALSQGVVGCRARGLCPNTGGNNANNWRSPAISLAANTLCTKQSPRSSKAATCSGVSSISTCRATAARSEQRCRPSHSGLAMDLLQRCRAWRRGALRLPNTQ